jgi:hypothetical protein
MAELTKQALKVANNTEFPNNNNGAITPSNLRGFNLDMIDSTVNQAQYTTDSGSWNQQIDALESFSGSTEVSITNLNASSASQQISINALNVFTASASGLQTGSLLVTASAVSNVITFTKGDASTFNVTVADTTDLTPLNTFTASAEISITNLNASSASQQVSINALNTNSASVNTSITNINSTTASLNTSVSNINSATQSLFTSASLGLTTASFASQTLTFTKGDGTTFGIVIPDVSGSLIPSGTISGSAQIVELGFQTTASFNSYTASQSTASLVTSIDNLNTFSASALTSISNLNQSSASQQVSIDALNTNSASVNTSITNINSATSSLFTSASLALVTASFDNGTRNLTFTKGDTQTFSVNIPDISGSAGNFVTTASFNAYTSSNDQRVSSLETNSGSVNTSITNLNSATSSLFTSASLGLTTASISGVNLTFTKGDGTQFTLQTTTGSVVSASFAESASYAQFATDIYLNVKNTTGAQLNKGTVVRIIGAVGDNALVATASWEDDNNSANTLGLLYENIPNDSFGKVITQGTLLGINTDPVLGYAAGQIIYLSSSGQFTNVIPPAPYHEVRLGQVLRAQQNAGSVYILIQNGYELSELHDVDINTGSLANNNLLAYNSASGQWENKTLTQVGATTTASFNAYTTSVNTFITSSAMRLDLIEDFTQSAEISITNINSATASLFTSTSLSLITASFDNGTRNLTFTKGDASTFAVNIPDVSGSTINTGSFATTGSNTFNGNQIINGLTTINVGAAGTETQKDFIVVTGSVINTIPFTNVVFGLQDYQSFGDNFKDAFVLDYWDSLSYNYGAAYEHNGIRTGTELLASGSGNSFGGKGYGINQLRVLGTGSFLNQYASVINIGSYAPSTTDFILIGHNALPYLQLSSLSNQITGSTIISGSNGLQLTGSLSTTGTFTSSLQEGYVWVGNSAGRTTTVATSSFGGGGAAFPFTGDAVITGSLLVSGSIIPDVRVIGNVHITGSLVGQPITLSVTSNTASIDMNAGNNFILTLPSSSVTHIAASSIIAGQTINLLIKQQIGPATGSITFAPSILFPSGLDMQATATGSAIDLVSMISFDTTNLMAANVKNLR